MVCVPFAIDRAAIFIAYFSSWFPDLHECKRRKGIIDASQTLASRLSPLNTVDHWTSMGQGHLDTFVLKSLQNSKTNPQTPNFTYVPNCKATVALLPKTTTPTLVESASIISRSTRLAANSNIWTENILGKY